MLIDTSAWVEYFKGTEKGKVVKDYMNGGKEIFTNPLTIAEITLWSEKNKLNTKLILETIYKNSEVLELSKEMLEGAGRFYTPLKTKKAKIGMIDVIIYVSCLSYGLDLLTSDYDFFGLLYVKVL